MKDSLQWAASIYFASNWFPTGVAANMCGTHCGCQPSRNPAVSQQYPPSLVSVLALCLYAVVSSYLFRILRLVLHFYHPWDAPPHEPLLGADIRRLRFSAAFRHTEDSPLRRKPSAQLAKGTSITCQQWLSACCLRPYYHGKSY